MRFIGYFTEKDQIFSDNNTGFRITRFHTEDGDIKIKGTFPDIPEGFIELSIKGEETSKFGTTYVVENYRPHLPIQKESVIKYLENFLSLSYNQGEKIFEHYLSKKMDTFDGLDNHPEEIDNIKGLFRSEDRKKEFLQKKSIEKAFRQVRFFLYDYGFSETQSQKILKIWGEHSLSIIQEKTYNLLIVEGVSFKQVDHLYFNLGGKRDDEMRLFAGSIYFLRNHCEQTKNSYIEYPLYKNLLQNELGVIFDDIKMGELLTKMKRENILERAKDLIFFDSLKSVKIDGGTFIIFLESIYNMEVYLAQKIARLLTLNGEKGFKLGDNTIGDKQMNEDQVRAVENCYNYNISIIRGYGGTGKSTIIKKIIEIAKEKKLTYTLLAPTGKAVDVLIKASDSPECCSTIHRKLMLQTEGKNSEIDIMENIILIDESSMKSLPLAYSLFSSFQEKPYTRVVIVGDDNQLEPIGIGCFFLSAIASQQIPEVRLTKIYRQKEDSLILENSKAVVENQNLDMRTTHDWEFFNTAYKNENEIADMILGKIMKEGWDNDKDVVIGAQYKGDAGITKLNERVQLFVQGKNPYFYEKGIHKFFLGDRVMHVNNNLYEKEDEKRYIGLPSEVLVDEQQVKNINKLFNVYSILPERDYVYNPKNGNIYKYRVSETEKEVEIKETAEGKIMGGYKEIVKVGKVGSIENFEVYIDEDVGDIKDLADKNIYNGNWGRIVALNTEQSGWVGYDKEGNVKPLKIDIPKKKDEEYVCLVDFGDKYFFYKRSELTYLSLFYASTVHKMQGSQFVRVYGVLNQKDCGSYFSMVSKKWLYTMISRAQEKFYYFSTEELTRKVQKISGEERKTLLAQFIKFYYTREKEKIEKLNETLKIKDDKIKE